MSDNDTTEMEFYAVVDSDGDYEVSKEEDEALERFEENVGGVQARRVFNFKLTVPRPKIAAVSATLPEKEDGEYSLEIQS